MQAIATRSSALVAAVLGTGLMLGVLAGIDARLGVLAALGLVFVVRVLDDLMIGVLLMGFLAFFDTLPAAGAFSPAKLVGALLVVSWLAYVISRAGRDTLLEDRAAFTYVLILFAAWVLVSLVWAESRGEATTSLTRYAPNLMLIPILYTAVRSDSDAVKVLGVIAGAAALSAFVAILQPPADPGSIGDPSRATSTVGDANELAAALVVGLVIAAAFAINRGFTGPVRVAFAASIPFCLVAILLTLSRGGLLALGAALAAAVVFSGARFRARAIAMAIVTGATAIFYFSLVAPPAARERVLEVGGGTGRVDLWTVAWRMVEDQPLRGVGAGNFEVSSIHYLLQPGVIQRDDFIITTPLVTHNTYLQVLAELGVVGLALFLGIVAFCFTSTYLAVRAFERLGDERMELLTRGLLISMIGLLTAIFFISEMYSKLFWLLLALGPALLAIARARERAPSPV